jgi:hypothetical protein
LLSEDIRSYIGGAMGDKVLEQLTELTLLKYCEHVIQKTPEQAAQELVKDNQLYTIDPKNLSLE